MSTRLGVKRTSEVVAASSRTGADGRLYYDVQASKGEDAAMRWLFLCLSAVVVGRCAVVGRWLLGSSCMRGLRG